MRMRLPTTPLVFILLTNACEPSPYPDDVDELVARWAATRADFEERCITPNTLNGSFARAAEPTLAATVAAPDSRIEIEAAFRQLFLAPDRQLDRFAFERCLAAHEALPSCPADPGAFFMRAGCAQLFVGAREEGDACATDAICAPGLFCDAPVLACGRCARDLSPVEPFRPCDDDPMCGLPSAPDEAGAPCEVNCGSGFYPAHACIEGQCVQRRVIDVGGACDSMYENPFGPRSLRHCREEDFGSSTCMFIEGSVDEGVCVANVRADVPGAFVPGAAVVSAAGDGGGAVFLLDCAP